MNKEIKKERWFKKHPVLLVLISLFIFVVLVAGCVSIISDDSSLSSTTLDKDACYMSHEFIKEVLKAPSTAKFQNCYDATITNLGDNTYYVKTWVDAENSFSAMIRTHYSMKLRYVGGDNWRMVEYDLIE